MAREDKPYRVYRGGRAAGGVPTFPRLPTPERRKRATRDGVPPRRYAGPGPAKRPRRLPPGRIVFLVVLALLLLVIGWTVAGYIAVGNGVEKANDRLSDRAKAQLTPQKGWMLSEPSTTLIVGIDRGLHPTRRGHLLADSIMLLRTDPDLHRLAYLSVPRDLEVEIPGFGQEKINATVPNGGVQLAIQTIREAFGMEINHVVLLDFPSFREVIDALGGIDVDVKKPVVTKVECPYPSAEQCARWGGWRFGKGRQHMNGRRALLYARIRKNELDPGESDLNRVGRQQQVIQATLDKMVSFRTYLRLPFIGEKMASPLTTDLSTNELFSLAWLRYRASDDRTFFCRLGLSGEDNGEVLLMFTGKSAIQPPSPITGAGCLRGTPLS